MSDDKIFNMQEMKKLAQPILSIPNFDKTRTINVRVQRPRLLDMAKQGEIPNHLLGIANQMLLGKKDNNKLNDKKSLEQIASMMELYARACLVEPKYEEFKEIITDEQGDAIFAFAMGEVSGLDSFRKNKKNDTDNTDGKKVSKKTK